MKWLLWKDYRLNRLIVFLTVFLVAVPHLTAVIITWYCKSHHVDDPISYFSMNLLGSAMYSLILSQLVFAFMGGNAISSERPDRSAEFLAYLPISRAKILASKVLLAVLIAASIWIINLSIIGICWANLPVEIQSRIDFSDVGTWNAMALMAITGLTFFCVGWFFSSFLESPVFSTTFGLISPMIVIMGIHCIGYYFGFQDPQRTILHWYLYITATLALISFPAGTCYYLRYAEP